MLHKVWSVAVGYVVTVEETDEFHAKNKVLEFLKEYPGELECTAHEIAEFDDLIKEEGN